MCKKYLHTYAHTEEITWQQKEINRCKKRRLVRITTARFWLLKSTSMKKQHNIIKSCHQNFSFYCTSAPFFPLKHWCSKLNPYCCQLTDLLSIKIKDWPIYTTCIIRVFILYDAYYFYNLLLVKCYNILGILGTITH